jgi:hypothetical protein
MPPVGRGRIIFSGSVSSWKNAKASFPDSSRLGWEGVGTKNPKSSASLLKEAVRMKCSVLLAASQMMITVWSAFTTGLPGREAGQQADATGDKRHGN